MAKNEIGKKGRATPASYNKKDFSSRTAANVTDIHRETYEPFKTTVEDIHSETVVTETSSSKNK